MTLDEATNESRIFISVVITAYRDRGYLLNALKSVQNQTLDKAFYEIIVVVGFYNADLEKVLNENSATTIFCDDPKQGIKLFLSLRKCRGEVICFLDDDDEWEPTRLSIIYDLFRKRRNLGYFHNAALFIESNGNISAINKKVAELKRWKNLKNLGGVVSAADFSTRRFRNLLNFSIDYNSSSIAIRTDILKMYVHALIKVDIAIDTFLFTISCISGYDLFIDSSKLTRQRISKSDILHYWNGAYQVVDNLARAEDSYKFILSLLKGNCLENNLVNYLKSQIALNQLNKSILSINIPRIERVRALIDFLGVGANRTLSILAIIFAFIGILSPNTSFDVLVFFKRRLE